MKCLSLHFLIFMFLCPFPIFTVVSSQITITESGGGVKRPGETLQLTCAVSGISMSSGSMHWFRQPPGKGLEWTAGVGSTGNLYYNSGLKNQLTVSRDTSKGQMFLQVRNLKNENSAMYYCAQDTVRKCFSKDIQKHFFLQISKGMSHSQLLLYQLYTLLHNSQA
uniref:Ig-like domain-containing protein n=1 Tax=Varanus komodoensis TaxID=61221 RepID=A0A8D2LJ57_VARKO